MNQPLVARLWSAFRDPSTTPPARRIILDTIRHLTGGRRTLLERAYTEFGAEVELYVTGCGCTERMAYRIEVGGEFHESYLRVDDALYEFRSLTTARRALVPA